MPLDPRAQRFLAMIQASGERRTGSSIDEHRRAFAALMAQAGPSRGACVVRDVDLPGPGGLLPARIYSGSHQDQAQHPGLVFFHGGGLRAGSLDTHDGLCATLAEQAQCRVVSVGYRLAPENPFPAAVEDAWAAVDIIFDDPHAHGLDADRIAVGGDSVGANLAASACQHLVGQGRDVRAQLLICPVLDARRRGASHQLFREGYYLDSATLDRDLAAYGGPSGLDLDDPRVSPSHGTNLSSLPPTIIETAEYDPVRDDGATYAEALRSAGVSVEYTCHPGMIHLFYGFGRVIPAGASALTDMGRRLRRLLADPARA